MELTLKCDCGNEEKIKLGEDNFQDDINKNIKFEIILYDGYLHIKCCSCDNRIEIYNC